MCYQSTTHQSREDSSEPLSALVLVETHLKQCTLRKPDVSSRRRKLLVVLTLHAQLSVTVEAFIVVYDGPGTVWHGPHRHHMLVQNLAKEVFTFYIGRCEYWILTVRQITFVLLIV